MGEWDERVPQTSFAFAAQAAAGDEVTAAKRRARNPACKPAKRKRSEPKASEARKGGRSEGRQVDSLAPSAPRRSAVELAKQARDISVSEFFAKNRHLLGFDNPSKALLTTVKEGVDNALDACEEAGILPDVRVEIRQLDETRFKVAIEDNGPGIVRAQVPKVFGRLLYGSKFHRLRQSRGQQGIGISAAGMYGLLTTGKPVVITTRTGPKSPAHHFELVEVVNEKDPETYDAIVRRLGVKPEEFCMVGNSVKSDVLPVLAIGGHAVHVPYPMTWALEHAEPGHFTFAELDSLADLPAWLREQ